LVAEQASQHDRVYQSLVSPHRTYCAKSIAIQTQPLASVFQKFSSNSIHSAEESHTNSTAFSHRSENSSHQSTIASKHPSIYSAPSHQTHQLTSQGTQADKQVAEVERKVTLSKGMGMFAEVELVVD